MSTHYSYAEKLPPEQVAVTLDLRDPHRGTSLERDLAERATRFGYTFFAGATPPDAESFVIRHLLCVLDAPFSEELAKRCCDRLSDFTSVSVAFRYETPAQMLACRWAVEDCKELTGDRVNFLRPDVAKGQAQYVSDEKIIENAVCDTVRVKYSPHRRDPELPTALLEGNWAFFVAASQIIGENRLYHRSPSDGYLAIRAAGVGGFLITATKTDKVALSPADISWVHGYDEQSNVLWYSGPRLPSSDSVEAAILFSQCPRVGAALHTHASRDFTRNPQYADRIRVGRLPYGEPALGHVLAGTLRKQVPDFVIMDDHGEVFTGRDGETACGYLRAQVGRARAKGRSESDGATIGEIAATSAA